MKKRIQLTGTRTQVVGPMRGLIQLHWPVTAAAAAGDLKTRSSSRRINQTKKGTDLIILFLSCSF